MLTHTRTHTEKHTHTPIMFTSTGRSLGAISRRKERRMGGGWEKKREAHREWRVRGRDRG